MRRRCISGFSLTLVPKLLLPPNDKDPWPKNGQILASFGPSRPMPDQNTMQTRYLGVFSVMWVPKLLLSPVEIRIVCPKTTQFCPRIAFLVFLGQGLPAYLVPRWWAGWWLWRAGCISQDTYLLHQIKEKPPLQSSSQLYPRQLELGLHMASGISVPPSPSTYHVYNERHLKKINIFFCLIFAGSPVTKG